MSAPPDPKSVRREHGLARLGQGRLTAMALTDAERKTQMSHLLLQGGGLTKPQIDNVPLEGAFQRFRQWLLGTTTAQTKDRNRDTSASCRSTENR